MRACAAGLPEYDTASPALPSWQGTLAPQSAETLRLSSPGGDVRPWLDQAVVGPQVGAGLRRAPGRRRALAVEARLASLRLQHFKSDVAFDRVNSTRLSDQQHPGGLDQIGEHQPVTAFGDAAGAIGLARAVASRGQAEIGADIGGAAETP